MRTRRRDIEIFSLSFLDVICCGFGAIILLFVLSKFAEPVIIEELSEDLQSVIVRLEEELYEIRGETAVLNRELQGKKEQLSEEKKNLARLQGLSFSLGDGSDDAAMTFTGTLAARESPRASNRSSQSASWRSSVTPLLIKAARINVVSSKTPSATSASNRRSASDLATKSGNS